MKIMHAKSPCCRASVNRFGQRRRVCVACGQTWRIRQKKRGRKRKRANEYLILRFFEKRLPPLRAVAQARCCGKDAVRLLLQRSLASYLGKHHRGWLELLESPHPLIAVADAIWYHVNRQKHTIYVILLRPAEGNEAVICPPVIWPGHEDVRGWRQAFSTLPKVIQNRIIGLVSDGATSLVLLAKTKPWVIQRCHFHLISAVQNYLTTGPRSPHRKLAIEVMNLVQGVLRTNNPQKLKPLVNKLEAVRCRTSSRGLRRVLGGLINDLPEFHTYLDYPRLNLPTTSNAAESFIQCIRDLMYRCRGFRSLGALQRWLVALSAFKSVMRCNGKVSTKLNR